jgi:hypothetical protein
VILFIVFFCYNPRVPAASPLTLEMIRARLFQDLDFKRVPTLLEEEVTKMNTASNSGPTHKRAERRASVWGSVFTIKAATLRGGVRINRAQLFCMWVLAQLLLAPAFDSRGN